MIPTRPSRRPRGRASTAEVLAGKTLEEVEKAAVKSTLDANDGNKSAAARALGIASSTLYEKIKKYGLS
jgi:transcriptional regulator with PAS, ATPase and Fis domain